MTRYAGRTLIGSPSAATWGQPVSTGGLVYGTATGGTSSSITDGGISYTLLTFTSDGTLTVSKAGAFELFLCGGGGDAGTNFIGRTYGDSGGTGAAVTICKMTLPVGTYNVDVAAPATSSIFATGTVYRVEGYRGNRGGSTGEFQYGPDTQPPMQKLTAFVGWPSSGVQAQDPFDGILAAPGTVSAAFDVQTYNGKKSVSTTGGSALDGVSLTFSGSAYNYGSGGAYSNGQQGTGAGARGVASSKYGAGGGGGDSNGGQTAGYQGIIMVRFR